MRCSCQICGTYMVHSESLELGCVCPECGYRCKECLGTNTVMSREELSHLRENPALAAYLLPLQALESTFAAVDAAALPDVRARAALAADLLRKEASTRDIALRLNTKPRK